MSLKILLHLGILLCHIFKSQADGQGSFSRLPAINHCREIVVKNYMPERIPSLLMEVSCELGPTRSSCGRFSEVSLDYIKTPQKTSFYFQCLQMTSMIEVAYISQEVCNTEGSLGGIVYKRNMTINVGCGCILGKSRNGYIQIERLESTSDQHEVRIINKCIFKGQML